MTKDEKKALIERYRHGIDELEASLRGLAEGAYDFVPQIEGAWTIRAQVAHLLDADMFGWTRIRKAVAQPGAPVDIWDQEAWAARLDYPRADMARTLYQDRIIREALSDFLESRIDEDWSALAMSHPERGRKDLGEIVAMYADHVGFHLKLIERNAKAYAERR
jgi:hypothetical protein